MNLHRKRLIVGSMLILIIFQTTGCSFLPKKEIQVKVVAPILCPAPPESLTSEVGKMDSLSVWTDLKKELSKD